MNLVMLASDLACGALLATVFGCNTSAFLPAFEGLIRTSTISWTLHVV